METCQASDLKERHIKSNHLVGIVEREKFWIFLKKVYAVLIGLEYAVNSLCFWMVLDSEKHLITVLKNLKFLEEGSGSRSWAEGCLAEGCLRSFDIIGKNRNL